MINKNWLLILLIVVSCTSLLLADEENAGLNVGDQVPDFVLNNQDGELWRLADFLGKNNIVVYFYPAAMTGGCTKQACSYRDARAELEKKDILVVGISSDAVKNLKVFQKANQLNFNLLSDASGEVARKFGVPTREGGSIVREVEEKDVSLYRSFTPSRWTFIIDKEGKIAYKDVDVDAADDSKNVLDFFKP
jgi:peroxiredoxin Q/BCP